MKLKANVFIFLSFISFICGILNIYIFNKGKVNVSYIVDRSLSSLFISDQIIHGWIKEDIEQNKVDYFNIISFGCDFNQSQTFSYGDESFYIPKINNATCSNLNNVLNSGSVFNNIVVISDLKLDYNFTNTTSNIRFVRLDNSAFDTLKIVSWQIPNVVVNKIKIRGVIQVISKVNDIVEVTIHYASKVKRYYKKVWENRYEYIPFSIQVKSPFKSMKIKVTDVSNNDKYILNNVIIHKFAFIDKIPTHIESKYANIVFEQNKEQIENSLLEKSEILIIDSRDLKKALNLIKRYNNTKHLVIFLDTFVLNDIATYKKIEKFLPIMLVCNKQRRIFFLIDISGSMNIIEESGKFNMNSATILNGIIELLKKQSEFANPHIYLFNDKYKEIPFLNIEELKAKLLNIQFFGNTFIAPVLEEIYEQVKSDDYIYIFSDTVVKDKINKLEQVIGNIKKKNGKLFLFLLGEKKSRLYKVFRKFKQKIFNFANIRMIRRYKQTLKGTDKTTCVNDFVKIYARESERYLFSINNLLNTKLKDRSINILYTHQKPFLSYSLKNNYINFVILKDINYFIKNNLSIKEILSPVFGVIAQKKDLSIHPYYFNDRIRIHLNEFNTVGNCHIIKLKTKNKVIYLFEKSNGIYESGSVTGMDIQDTDMELDICGEKRKISLDSNFRYHNEIFFTKPQSIQFYHNANTVEFPQHSESKSKINYDNKSIIWFIMSFILLMIEGARRII